MFQLGKYSCFLLILLLVGCESRRLSYRYGDGSVYDPIDAETIKQKVCLRSLKFINEKETRITRFDELRADEPSVSDIVSYVSDIMTEKSVLGGLSVDVTVRFKKLEVDSSNWESVIWVIPTIPFYSHHKREAVVEIRESGSDKLMSSSILTGRFSQKLSVILFLGAIHFDHLDGYQENVINYEHGLEKDEEGQFKVDENGYPVIIRSVKILDAFNRALAHCIAMQLRKCALDRLSMPDVKFDME